MVERRNQTLLGLVRSMMENLPITFLGEMCCELLPIH